MVTCGGMPLVESYLCCRVSHAISSAHSVVLRVVTEFNWSAVSTVERKGRGSMVVATTDKSVNVAALHRLSVGKQRECLQLPTLDAVIEQLVEDAEDDAPVSTVLSMEEAVLGDTVVVGVPAEGDGEDDDVALATTEELEQLDRAQALLLADWSTRDTLLD